MKFLRLNDNDLCEEYYSYYNNKNSTIKYNTFVGSLRDGYIYIHKGRQVNGKSWLSQVKFVYVPSVKSQKLVE